MKKCLMMVLTLALCASCAAKKPVTQPVQPQQPAQTTSSKADKIQAMKDSIELIKLQMELDAALRDAHAANEAGTEVSIPCIESSMDDADYFRDLGIGVVEGNNLQNARYAAIDGAKTMIKKRLGEFIQGVTTTYTENYSGSTPANAVQSKIANKFNGVVEKMLNDADKECEKRIVNSKGVSEFYYVVRIPKSDLKKAMVDIMKQEAKDRVDFNEHQMQKFMDERMEDMRKAKEVAGY